DHQRVELGVAEVLPPLRRHLGQRRGRGQLQLWRLVLLGRRHRAAGKGGRQRGRMPKTKAHHAGSPFTSGSAGPTAPVRCGWCSAPVVAACACTCCASAWMSCVLRASCNLRAVMILKNIGTKKIARNVAASMPPITPVPTERRAAAPAPVEYANGSTPRMKASDVMMIGRKRSRAASSAVADALMPSWCLSDAYSTIRIAFLAARPSSVTRPIWKYTSLVMPRSHTAANAPKVPNGSANNTLNGSDHFSYCAERMRNTINAPSTSASPDVPEERFSWYDAPPQSKLKSGGSTSRAMRSTSAIACPELMPGAPWPNIFTAGRLLKRSSVSGPDEYLMLASADTGTICPESERTHMRPMSSGRLRKPA